MQETQVQSLGQEDSLEKGMAPHSSIFAWRNLDRRAWWTVVHGVAGSDRTEQLTLRAYSSEFSRFGLKGSNGEEWSGVHWPLFALLAK